MSTHGARETLRGYHRRKNLDLNVPPSEIRDQEGPSTQEGTQGVQASQQGPSLPPAMIDVESVDDDVVESSPRAFAEAKSKRNRATPDVVVLESDGRVNRSSHNNRSKRRRIPPRQNIVDCEYINLESGGYSTGSVKSSYQSQPVPVPPPPPKEPTFNCPICMGPLSEEMSTRCGHIFCKKCIKAAIATQGKCPTCRKRVTVKELIRVFLPATS